jgi:hypothetical protein
MDPHALQICREYQQELPPPIFNTEHAIKLQEFEWLLVQHHIPSMASPAWTQACNLSGFANTEQRLFWVAHLDVFSHVVECIFLLRQDNVICQALLDLWQHSGNPCTIYVLLMVPLDTLTITYSRTSDVLPLSNVYKNWITQF